MASWPSQAKGELFATFAFGMHPVFQEAYRSGTARLRYALLEKLIGPGMKKAAQPAALAAMKKLRFAVESKPQFLDPSGEWWKRHFGDTAFEPPASVFDG